MRRESREKGAGPEVTRWRAWCGWKELGGVVVATAKFGEGEEVKVERVEDAGVESAGGYPRREYSQNQSAVLLRSRSTGMLDIALWDKYL